MEIYGTGWFASINDRRIAWLIAVIVVSLYSVFFLVLSYVAVQNGADIGEAIIAGDSEDYISLAHTIRDTHRFALEPSSSPEFFRAPGYPVFLAFIMGATGMVLAVPAIQVLLTAVSAALVFLIGRRHFSIGVSIGAALLFALEPMVVVHTGFVLSEPLFMPLFLAAVFFADVPALNLGATVLAGAFLGLSALVRPVGIYLLPLIALMAFIRAWPEWKKGTRAAAILGITACIVVAPWVLRNASLSGHAGLSSVGTYNMLYYNVAGFEAQRRGISIEEARAPYVASLKTDDTIQLRSFAYADQESALIREVLHGHVLDYARFHIMKTAVFFFGTSIGSAVLMAHNQGVLSGPLGADVDMAGLLVSGKIDLITSELMRTPLETLERLLWFAVCLAVAYAVYMHLRRRTQQAGWIVLACLSIGFFAILTGPVSSPRYRIPAEPFLFLLGLEGMVIAVRSLLVRARMMPRIMREASRYVLVSACAFGLDTGLLIFCTQILHIPYLISGAIGFTVGLLFVYALSIQWVFENSSARFDRATHFTMFAAIGLGGLGLNEALLWLFTEQVGLYYVVSKIAVAAFVLVYNFALRKLLLFSSTS